MTSATLIKGQGRDRNNGMVSFTFHVEDKNKSPRDSLFMVEELEDILRNIQLVDIAYKNDNNLLIKELKGVADKLIYFIDKRNFYEEKDNLNLFTHFPDRSKKFSNHFKNELNNPNNSVLEAVSIEIWKRTGTKTINFVEKYNETPVYGSLVVLEVYDNHNTLNCVSAIDSTVAKKSILSFVEKGKTDIIKPNQIESIIRKLAKDEVSDNWKLQTKLYYYFDYSSVTPKWRLVYFVENKMRDINYAPSVLEVPSKMVDYVIDAYTGNVVNKISNIRTIR
ncbi:hypothetical protein COO91_06852 [Nostoc flagelliforme CCNUN1]|uniref:Uncharacterized protein n=1 Tax=Nostoc flagelliforme CCNUN1 TaxID=2038116 RepID=A0A2K8SZP6_9NOSO|nr:hypothetical protein [Nostoc flagelliforme]AUB40823.1 hypothetical protein COO91_06852 [Nostoc flagelliforme CCNUN1]